MFYSCRQKSTRWHKTRRRGQWLPPSQTRRLSIDPVRQRRSLAVHPGPVVGWESAQCTSRRDKPASHRGGVGTDRHCFWHSPGSRRRAHMEIRRTHPIPLRSRHAVGIHHRCTERRTHPDAGKVPLRFRQLRSQCISSSSHQYRYQRLRRSPFVR
jgi:hypothetical protein